MTVNPNILRRSLASLVCVLTIGLASPAIAAPKWQSNDAVKAETKERILVAKATRKKNRKARGTRERIISREARTKGKDARNIDFDSVDIGGQRKTPMGSFISQNQADKNYDFVKIRLRWHPEMVQSASSLEAGGQ